VLSDALAFLGGQVVAADGETDHWIISDAEGEGGRWPMLRQQAMHHRQGWQRTTEKQIQLRTPVLSQT